MNSQSQETAAAMETDHPVPTILNGQYFRIAEFHGRNVVSVCQICEPTARNMIKGQITSSSNFLRHLKRKHPVQFEMYKTQSRQGRRNTLDGNEDDSNNSTTPATPVGEDQRGEKRSSREQFEVDVTNYVISAMVPLRSVEDTCFRRIFKNLGVPDSIANISRRTVGRTMAKMFVQVNNKIVEELRSVPFVCTTADVWSARKRRFFGVTAHWISSKYERKSVALACRRFAGAHSYDRITDMLSSIHAEFGLTNDKIIATVTDNGSNFAKAFRKFGVHECAIGTEDEEETIETGFLETEEEEAEEEEDENENETFEDYMLPRHIRCAAHTLNLCVTTDLVNAIEAEESLSAMHKGLLQKCNILWRASIRPKAAEEIYKILGRALKRPVETRWNSLYDSFKQLYKNKDKIPDLWRAVGERNIIRESEFLYMEEHLKCTAPIATAIDILQGEKNIFYGTLLPCLLSLRRKLRLLTEDNWTFCGSLSVHLVNSVEIRFQEHFGLVTTEADNAGIAALTHPHFKNRWLNCMEESCRNALMESFRKRVVEELQKSNPPAAGASTSSSTSTAEENFFDFGEAPSDETMDYESEASLQILHFLKEKSEDWKILEKYPAIKAIFFKENTPLPSSGPVERLFSYATMTNCPKRNRLSDLNFERRVLLKANLKETT